MFGKGTCEEILNICQIIEKSKKFNLKIYMYFEDYFKAFDMVH